MRPCRKRWEKVLQAAKAAPLQHGALAAVEGRLRLLSAPPHDHQGSSELLLTSVPHPLTAARKGPLTPVSFKTFYRSIGIKSVAIRSSAHLSIFSNFIVHRMQYND
jgi:hypothetical protein